MTRYHSTAKFAKKEPVDLTFAVLLLAGRASSGDRSLSTIGPVDGIVQSADNPTSIMALANALAERLETTTSPAAAPSGGAEFAGFDFGLTGFPLIFEEFTSDGAGFGGQTADPDPACTLAPCIVGEATAADTFVSDIGETPLHSLAPTYKAVHCGGCLREPGCQSKK